MHRRARLSLALLLAAAAVAGCSGDPEPGPDAGDPACAGVAGRLPGTVLDESRGELDVAGTAVWGDPRIVLRCGVEAPGVSNDPCLDVEGVDWLFTEPGGDFRFTLYGRTPVVELTVPSSYGRENAPGALAELAPALAPLPQSRECT